MFNDQFELSLEMKVALHGDDAVLQAGAGTAAHTYYPQGCD